MQMAGTPKAGIIALVVLALSSNDLMAQGPPVETGSHLPVAMWFVGAGLLALAIVYGIMRNKRRTLAEKRITDQATTALYAEEERERKKS